MSTDEKHYGEDPLVLPIGYLVTERIEPTRRWPLTTIDYPLLPGDLLLREELTGTYRKVCPGASIGGFDLSEDDKATLRKVTYTSYGLNYTYEGVDE